MKKRERIAMVQSCVLRVAANISTPAQIKAEVDLSGFYVTEKEAEALVANKVWEESTVTAARNLGLVKKSGKKGDRSTGGRVGNVQNTFAAAHPTLYNGTDPFGPDAEQLLRRWVGAYGLRNGFKILRKVVKETDKEFNVGIYFITEKDEAPTGGEQATAQTQA